VKKHLTIIGVLAISAVEISAQTFQVIHSFDDGSDGANPQASLVLDGNTLFGTTANGGTNGYGTVFKVNTDGTGYSILKSFTNSPDGANPVAGLVLSGGTLYGTTYSGGANGYGTVFSINTNGTGFAILQNFAGSDGANPAGGLILHSGILYGTTANGGNSGNGTIFSLFTNGTGYTVLKDFTNNPDGANPQAGLLLSSNMLYGTTFYGGTNGYGTVFSLQTNGTGFAVLKNFTGDNSDAANPHGDLILSGSALYGTTFGHTMPFLPFFTPYGTVFRVNMDGTGFSILCNFYGLNGGWIDIGAYYPGCSPFAGLVLSGNTLYGTTKWGGQADGSGSIFEVNTDGTDLSYLKEFGSPFSDGLEPQADLILNGGTLYGTTAVGGSGYGVVFSLTFPPQIQLTDGSFGVRTNHFGFNLTGFSNQVVVIEACTNLMTGQWSPLQTNTLGTNTLYFSDPMWTNYPDCFYRVRTQ
jgi:uncharacterized repeat protein (TIGR03803 family)